jgi:hypothetical protein
VEPRDGLESIVAEVSEESLVDDAVVEAVDNILLRDVGDGGACVEEAAGVGSQELVTFLFALRQTIMSTCSSDRPFKVVGEDSLQIIPRVEGVFPEALQPCEWGSL